jgi:hypothetical protein
MFSIMNVLLRQQFRAYLTSARGGLERRADTGDEAAAAAAAASSCDLIWAEISQRRRKNRGRDGRACGRGLEWLTLLDCAGIRDGFEVSSQRKGLAREGRAGTRIIGARGSHMLSGNGCRILVFICFSPIFPNLSIFLSKL